MKIHLAIFVAVAVLGTHSAFGQDSLSFYVSADSAHAVPPNSSSRTATGTFTLDAAGLFSGAMGIENFYNINSMTIFRSASPDQAGTALYDFTPGLIVIGFPELGIPFSQEFDFQRSLTPSEVTDVRSGLWWVSVITPGFPDGEIRGQITAVPEPSTISLLVAGGGWLCYSLRARRTKKQPPET